MRGPDEKGTFPAIGRSRSTRAGPQHPTSPTQRGVVLSFGARIDDARPTMALGASTHLPPLAIRRCCAPLLGMSLLLASPAVAQDDCPKYDVFADAASAEIVAKDEMSGWARQALEDRYEQGATCFVFVAVISANTASATYVSLRASRGGERVVLAERQSVATGTKAYRRRGIRKALEEFIAEKTASEVGVGAAATSMGPSRSPGTP